MKDLKDILQRVEEFSREGKRKELTKELRQLSDKRKEYYQESEQKGLQDAYADALYKMLLLEMDEEEEDSIEIAELAYLGLGNVLKQQEFCQPEHYKRRLLLLHYFCDYFTDAVIEVFLSRYRAENILQARSLAIECLEKMQLSDMYYLEENEPEFINGDEQLTDACNSIETPADLSEDERKDAALLHKVLHAYLRAKYKKQL